MKKRWIPYIIQIAAIVFLFYAIYTYNPLYLLIGFICNTAGYIVSLWIPQDKKILSLLLSIISLMQIFFYVFLNGNVS